MARHAAVDENGDQDTGPRIVDDAADVAAF
jgi:hypothetical protein